MMVNEESDFEKAVLKMSIWSPRSYDQGYAMFLKFDLLWQKLLVAAISAE